jgi:hypothetical protein
VNQHIFPRPEAVSAVRTQWRLLAADARRVVPTVASELTEWVATVLGPRPEDAFTALESYPLIHFPLWAAPDIAPSVLALLVRSSISGYLYVRLIDNAFDGDTDGREIRILPAASYLHTEFQLPYQQLFPFGHLFWDTFTSAWARAAEATLADRLRENPDVDDFRLVTARKTAAAIIPVAAALYATDKPGSMTGWIRFIDSFGRWHQLENDFFGWRKDQRHGNPNLVVAEALRRSSDPDDWFLTEGFEWATGLLARYADEAMADARTLACPDLIAYLELRLSAHRARLNSLRLGISENIRLATLLGTTAGRRDGV